MPGGGNWKWIREGNHDGVLGMREESIEMSRVFCR